MNINNIKNLNKLPALTDLFNQLLAKGIYYFDGECKKLSLDSQQQLQLQRTEKINNTVPIIIVARAYYREEVKSYPVDNIKELKKLLALELSEEALAYTLIQHLSEGESQVNIWRYQQSIPTALFTLPESLLFSLAHASLGISIIEGQPELFLGQRYGAVHSTLANLMINSTERFSMSTGVVDDEPVTHIAAKNITATLVQGLKKMPLRHWPSFFKTPKKTNKIALFNKIVLPFMVVFLGYLALSSLYLRGQHYIYQQQLENQSKQISTALATQQQLDENMNRHKQLRAFFNTRHNSASLWLILPDLFEHMSFNSIRYINQRYVFLGKATKATDILSRISQIKGVHDAKFDRSSRTSRGQENLVISFLLQGAVDE